MKKFTIKLILSNYFLKLVLLSKFFMKYQFHISKTMDYLTLLPLRHIFQVAQL